MAMPINVPEFLPNDTDADEDLQEDMAMEFANRRGCCNWFPCFGSSQPDSSWERISMTPEKEETTSWSEDWLKKGLKGLKKFREWSELVAGPKWKTFIRRFNKNRRSKSGGKFQYDPLSYALNFDEGLEQNGRINEDDDRMFRDFSSRYAWIPLAAKSIAGLGKDTPSFT